MKFFGILALGLAITFQAQAYAEYKENKNSASGADLSQIDEEYVANNIFGNYCEKCESQNAGGTWTRPVVQTLGASGSTSSKGDQ